MQSKRRLIVGWRQVPVQKLRNRAGRPTAALAVGAAPAPHADADAADRAGESPPVLPDPDE